VARWSTARDERPGHWRQSATPRAPTRQDAVPPVTHHYPRHTGVIYPGALGHQRALHH